MTTEFRFKQFTVQQDRCAMKVGTDGILLGAWAGRDSYWPGLCRKILDIGAGTGLIALMLAQRFPEADINAVEIDPEAAAQCAANFQNSLWSRRLRAISGCVTQLPLNFEYDLIVSNPPWFNDSLKSPAASRNLARHTETLRNSDLLGCVLQGLSNTGRFCTILAAQSATAFVTAAKDAGLFCHRSCHVRPTASAAPKRILLEFARLPVMEHLKPEQLEPAPLEPEQLIVEGSQRHEYTPEFRALTREFYLRF